jgi:hypothetical protein
MVKPVKVREYKKKSGTHVRAHERDEAKEKPKAWVQIYFDPGSCIATAYNRNCWLPNGDMDPALDELSEFEICESYGGWPDDATQEEVIRVVNEEVLVDMADELEKRGYSRTFHRMEDI